MGMRGKTGNALVAFGLVCASLALAVLLAEGVLRLAVNPADFLHATLVNDPWLGHRIEPNTTGHDALGFRNRAAPAQADIVAIGDSNTYGVSAAREGAWPQQLSVALGQPVYNMGLGGYGPLQYLQLARTTAKSMQPKVLLVGFYYGNDLMDGHLVAHANGHWKDYRRTEQAAEPEAALAPADAAPRKRFEGLRDWLSRHSVFYSVLRATVLQRFAAREREAMARAAPPDRMWPWVDPEAPSVRTTFTPQTRLSAVDPALPAVREGLDIAKRALGELQAEARAQGARLVVLLIPTKERAYCRYLQAHPAAPPPASLARLCEAEPAAAAELMAFLDREGIERLDLVPVLEAKIDQHVQLYPLDADGHPQASGYGVIAEAVARQLKRGP